MNSTPEPRKHVLSKGSYYFLRTIFTLLGTQGFVLAAVGVVGIFYLFARWHHTLAKHPVYTASMLCSCAVAIIGGALLVRTTNNASKEIDFIPLSRANTTDSPTSNSLVRASQEPAQGQKEVLLRAAGAEQEQHSEQLLRASGEQE